MKKITILTVILVSLMTAGYAQKMPYQQPGLELKETGFDFGKIPQGRPVTHDFEIVNTTKKPIMIENVQASCGCTTPEWSRDPVAPGASSTIKVGFNAGAEGQFSKTITVFYNSKETKVITIKGDVYPSPTTSAPLNSSLSIIK